LTTLFYTSAIISNKMSVISSAERSRKYRLKKKETETEDKREILRRKDATLTAARRAAESDVERGIRLQKAASSTAVQRAAETGSDH
jgi:flagellar capping protein FliD